jgi:hypothetical protein
MLPAVRQSGNPPQPALRPLGRQWLAQALAGLQRRASPRQRRSTAPATVALPLPAAASAYAPPAPIIPLQRPHLAALACPDAQLPAFVTQCAVARKYLALLGPLDWAHFPERPTHRPWPGKAPAPRAPYVAAYLVKLNEGLRYMSTLRAYLTEHPALVWLLGFPLVPDPAAPCGFDVEASLPDRRQFGRILRELPNPALQFLLDGTVTRIGAALPPDVNFADAISGDTKHVMAWVRENNPKAYVAERFNKHQQPTGDPDCKLGCKRRHNRGEGNGRDRPAAPPDGQPAAANATAESATGAATKCPTGTPTTRPVPVRQADHGEYYWGYASGVIATKVPGWGEFVLAELTQTFDKSDPSYFRPLMAQVVRRLGRKPRCGAFDAAFDAFYVYQWFHDAGGFAAVPLVEKGGVKYRTFSPDGLPLCAADLAMPAKIIFTDRHSTLVTHERAQYVCPLRWPTIAPQATCPIAHKNWPKGGCTAMMPTCLGARLRYQLDRHSAEFQELYQQRTADERVNAQAKELGIERPLLRRGSAIANQNTLIYVLINLRGLQRIQAHHAALAAKAVAATPPA